VTGGTVTVSPELADPIVDARDVVETFRQSDVLVDGWREDLQRAADSLVRLGPTTAELALSELGERMQLLLRGGFDQQRNLVEEIGQRLEAVLSRIRVPGIPRPEDEHWEF
jgi:hypothetical protein